MRQEQNLDDVIRAIGFEKAIDAELAAIAKRSSQAKRTNRAAIALFHDMAAVPGAHVGRMNERTADGRFASDDDAA